MLRRIACLFEDHFGIAYDGVERRAQVVAESCLSLRFSFLQRAGRALEKAIDKAVQLPCCSTDPVEIALYMDQTEIPRLLDQQFLETRIARAGPANLWAT